MRRRIFLKTIAAASLPCLHGTKVGHAASKKSSSKKSSKKPAARTVQGEGHDDLDPSWQPLFDGKSLAGWQPTFPTAAVGAAPPPPNVFSVIEEQGQNLLRVSGEIFAALTSITSFSNYHLRVQWRWGTAKWAPRAHLRRSSGIVVHSVPGNASFDAGKPWRPGLEFELQEGSCGDLWVGAGVRVDVPARRERFMGNPLFMYSPGYPMLTVPAPDAEPRVVKSNDYEKGFGEWNVADAYVFGAQGAFMTNGKLSMQWGNARTTVGDDETPLVEGPIALTSEGAEVYFRKIALRPLDKVPDRFRLPKKSA